MAEVKKYWYIQLNVNFFEDDRIDWLCEQKNGYAYVVLYLKLCLKTANNNGILTRQIGDMIIPYNVDKIAEITHMDVDVVRVALELYKKIGLVYEADETCSFMRLPEVPEMVKCTTQYAIDKAKQRRAAKLLSETTGQTQDNVQDNVRQELRDKSLELRDKKIEQEENEGSTHSEDVTKHKPEKHKYGQYKNVLLSDVELEKLKQEFPDTWEEKIERLSEYIESKGVSYKSHLATIRMWARKAGEQAQQRPDQKPKFTPEHIQQAKEMGITPEELLELKKRLRE